MAAKRIYQIAKEFECEEKKIIDFLTAQGIKVSNRLSAVSDETYNLLKEKLFAPPPPPPEPKPQPQPKPQPVAEQAAPTTPAPADQTGEAPAQSKKKKKKKNKKPQDEQVDDELEEFKDQPVPFMSDNPDVANSLTQAVYASAITAGNDFIGNYVPTAKRRKKAHLARGMDTWQLMQDIIIEDPDSSPICYWQAVNKLTTKGYKLLQDYGLKNRELLAEMREFIKPVGLNYEPQEIFTGEENMTFEEQQRFMFLRFGHGMGKVNDNLYELKMHAERKKAYCEHMSFVDYLTNNPNSLLETKIPMPFNALAEAMAYSIRSVVFHVDFYKEYKELIGAAIENFFAWKDGYKQLKEQGAPADKLEKYFKLMEKLFNLIEFFSFDNLVYVRKNQPAPFLTIINYLNEYRDNMDDPDAERNFKYKVRGLASILYKPKEYIFLYQLAELEPHKDYRTPEMIAEYEAKKAAKAAAEAEAAAQAQADSAEKENPAAQSDEA